MTTEPIDAEFAETGQIRKADAPAQSTALATTDNPYMAMAVRAMELGKVDQLDKLLDLQMKWDAEQARKAFVAAMADFKAEAGGITIAKNKHVSFPTSKGKTEYSHAELHDITRALVPVMARHGLSHRWVPQQEGAKITVTCVVTHRDGHSESVSLTASNDDSGGKNSIQSIASAKTYLERYTLLAATGIATGGELDDDGRSYGQAEAPPLVTDEQLATLQDLVDAKIRNKAQFIKWAQWQCKDTSIQSLADIPASQFEAVRLELANKKDAGNGAA